MKIIKVLLAAVMLLALAGCANEADVASQNVSKAADQFEVLRRVVFYNGINGEYMLTIEGYCSLGNFDEDGELTVTCEVAPGSFKKHFLGLSDNVTYFVEHMDATNVSTDHYRVVFKPSVILPDIEVN